MEEEGRVVPPLCIPRKPTEEELGELPWTRGSTTKWAARMLAALGVTPADAVNAARVHLPDISERDAIMRYRLYFTWSVFSIGTCLNRFGVWQHG